MDKEDLMRERFQEILLESKMSISDFANTLGVSDTYVREILHGERNVNGRIISSLDEKFNINVDWFWNGNGKKYKEIDL